MDIALQRSRIDIKGLSLAAWWLAMAVLCFVFATSFAQSVDVNDQFRGVSTILTGLGWRPFVYRVLPIGALRLLLGSGFTLSEGIWWIVAVSTIGAVAAFYGMTSLFDCYRDRVVLAVPLLIIFVVVLRSAVPFDEIYDMPTLALFTLSYALMLRRRWPAYLMAFAVTCLSKETAAFLTIGFAAAYFGRLSRRAYVGLGAAQFAIWLVVRLVITWSFAGYPGGNMENHMSAHLLMLAAYPAGVAAYAAIAAGVLAMVARRWREKPLELRRLFLAIAPLMAVLYVVGGVPFEFRVFYEIVPVTVLLCFAPSRDQQA